MRAAIFSLFAILPAVCATSCESQPSAVQVIQEIEYVSGSHDPSQTLDLYLPPRSNHEPLPLIVFIHGGAWRSGSKAQTLSMVVAKEGFASASLEYRLSNKAPFPAQIEDCKAAIRWLRQNAKKYHYDPNRIGVLGTSAGGHLCALLGTSGGTSKFETSSNKGVSDEVQAVCDWSGPTNLLAYKREATTDDEKVLAAPGGLIDLFLGGPIEEKKEAVKDADPTTYISKRCPPILIIHGDKDETVPLAQSQDFYKALKAAGVDAELITVQNGTHHLYSEEAFTETMKFFKKYLDPHRQ